MRSNKYPNATRALTYRKVSIYKILSFGFLFIIFFIIGFTAFDLKNYYDGILLKWQLEAQLIVNALIVFSLLIIDILYLRKRINTTFFAYYDYLKVQIGSDEKKYFFKDLKKVSYIPQSNQIILKFRKKTMTIGSEIERAEYIIEAIKGFRPSIFKDLDYNEIRTKLVFEDHQSARLINNNLKLSNIFQYFLLPTFFGGITFFKFHSIYPQDSTLLFLEGIFLVSLFIILGIKSTELTISKILLSSRLKKQMSKNKTDKRRDMSYEKSLKAKIIPVTTLCSIFLFLSTVQLGIVNYRIRKVPNQNTFIVFNLNQDASKENSMNQKYYLIKSNDKTIVAKLSQSEDTEDIDYRSAASSDEQNHSSLKNAKNNQIIGQEFEIIAKAIYTF